MEQPALNVALGGGRAPGHTVWRLNWMDDGRAEGPRGAGRGEDSREETAKLPTQAPTSLEGKSTFYALSRADV